MVAYHDPREERGKAIAEVGGVKRISPKLYRVTSQSGKGSYGVRLAVSGWTCSCPDHFYREIKCKHLWAVEFSQTLREKVRENLVIQPVEINSCLFCHSSKLKKFGIRHNKQGDIQRFLCADCSRTFSVNIGFEKMKHDPHAITTAMQLYFSGESLRNSARSLKLLGVQVTHQTVYNWIRKYVALMGKYLNQVKPQVSDTWRADEMWLKVKGNPKYLYALLDDETRYWIAKEVGGDKFSHDATGSATALFHQGKVVTGKRPHALITDGLRAYHLAYKREFFAHREPTKHIQHITWRKDQGNEKMEAFNGTVRSREKVMRSLKREDSAILDGYQIFHNYVRGHEALDGKTPAETCGIKVEGDDKWLTLIQNASRVRSRQ